MELLRSGIERGILLPLCKTRLGIRTALGYVGLVLFVLHLFVSVPPATGDTKIVDGNMEFVFELHSGNQEILDSFYEYENNSNSQEVLERSRGRIRVKTTAKLQPFESDIPYPVGERYRGGKFSDYLDLTTSQSGVRITRRNGEVVERSEFTEKTSMKVDERRFLRERAEKVSEGAETQHEAVERIMRHIRENVSYRLKTSSNPVDVLKRGEAYCEGYANAGALLLQSLGIPARVMDSYIPPGHMWGFGEEGAGGYHAHVEVYYGDAGWVSYDPQATVHYVDPFHIVNYPRQKVRIEQLNEEDERRILDRLYEPGNWDNFYQRRTDEVQHNPLLVGTIYTRNGRRVEDSFRSGEWVYRRVPGGEGEGIRILSNGRFAVSPEPGEETATFFYRDGNGGWMEDTIRFQEPVRKTETYRLDEPEEGYTLFLGGEKELYIWFKDRDERWKLDTVSPDAEGTVFLLSGGGRWVVSLDRQLSSRKYSLDTEKLEKGESYGIEELPRYYDPDTLYVSGTLPPTIEEGATVKLVREDGARTEPIPLAPDGTFGVPRPNEDFTMILLEGDALIGLKGMSFREERKSHLQRVYEEGGGIDYPDFLGGLEEYRVETGVPGARVYLGERRGNRFGEFGRTTADGKGWAVLYVDPRLNESEDLYVLYGTPQPKGRTPLNEAENGVLSFE